VSGPVANPSMSIITSILYYNRLDVNLRHYRPMLRRRTSRLCGFTRLVRLVRRAWRILVRARVRLSFWACAISGAAEQSDACGTVRPARGPVSQRQASLGPPDLVRLNTILCSVTNSCALICCPVLLLLGNDRMHTLNSGHSSRLYNCGRSVLDDDNNYT